MFGFIVREDKSPTMYMGCPAYDIHSITDLTDQLSFIHESKPPSITPSYPSNRLHTYPVFLSIIRFIRKWIPGKKLPKARKIPRMKSLENCLHRPSTTGVERRFENGSSRLQRRWNPFQLSIWRSHPNEGNGVSESHPTRVPPLFPLTR